MAAWAVSIFVAPDHAETADLSTELKEASSTPPRRKPWAQQCVWTRLVWGTLYAKAGLLGLVLLIAGGLYVRLSTGPISIKWLGNRMAAALAEQIGPNWAVTLRGS